MVSLSEHPVFVIVSYITGIFTITVAAKYEFISKKWSKVRETRIVGKFVLITASLSSGVLLTYIVVQAKMYDGKRDVKEACAGSVALVLSFFNFYRSFMGLWELYCFSYWAETARKRLETLLEDDDGGFPGKNDVESVDEMEVNQSIITGEINISFDGSRRDLKFLHLYSNIYLLKIPVIDRIKDLLLFPIIYFILLFCSGKEEFLKVPTAWTLVRGPEEHYVRWATVFLAFHPSIIKNSGRRRHNAERNTARPLEIFRRKVLIYCSLHITDDENNRKSLEYRTITDFQHLNQGFFSNCEFLIRASQTGEGLPFTQKHDYNNNHAYLRFEEKMKRFLTQLPIDKAHNIEIEDIEWLTVFTSVHTWKSESPSSVDNKKSIEKILLWLSVAAVVKKWKAYRMREETPKKGKDEAPWLDTNPCVQNLCEQLGLPRSNNPEHDLIEKLKIHPAMVMNEKVKEVYQHNKNILQISFHLDNWIALKTGENSIKFKGHLEGIGLSQKYPIDYQKCYRDNVEIEKTFRSFLVSENPQIPNPFPEKACFLAHLRFLGCGMETLRSKLAQRDPEKYKWAPDMKEALETSSSTIGDNRHWFAMSIDLRECINASKDDLGLSLKMRILYELQQYMFSHFYHNKRLFSVLLCLLFFPSIDIKKGTQRDLECLSRRDGVGIMLGEEERCFTIQPVLGPQKFKVIVRVSLKDSKVYFSLDRDQGENESRFFWEAWRNAFLGRINGAEKWEEECQPELPNTPRSFTGHKTRLEDGKGFLKSFRFLGYEVTLWPMWMPHKCSICFFEQEKLRNDCKGAKGTAMEKRKNESFDFRVLTLKYALDYYEKNVKNCGNIPDPSERYSWWILRERATALKNEKKYHLAGEQFFRAAIDHDCIRSLGDCIANFHRKKDYAKSADSIEDYIRCKIKKIDSRKGIKVMKMLKGILKDSGYAIRPVRVFSNIAEDFPHSNERVARETKEEAKRLLVISLRKA